MFWVAAGELTSEAVFILTRFLSAIKKKRAKTKNRANKTLGAVDISRNVHQVLRGRKNERKCGPKRLTGVYCKILAMGM